MSTSVAPQREVELPVELGRRIDERLDEVACCRSRTSRPPCRSAAAASAGGTMCDCDLRAELQEPAAVDVLDGVEAEAVDARVLDPLHGVVHRVVARRLHGVVPVRQVARRTSSGRACAFQSQFCPQMQSPLLKELGQNQPGLLLVDRAVDRDVHHRVVEEHLELLRVRRGRRASFRSCSVPKRGSGWLEIVRPVAVVARVVVRVAADALAGEGVGVLHGHREPQRVDAEVVEVAVVDLLRDARPVAALVGRAGNGTPPGVEPLFVGSPSKKRSTNTK